MAMKDIKSLLQLSIEQYKTILDHTMALPNTLGQIKPEAIKSFCGTLRTMQENTRQTDEALGKVISERYDEISPIPEFQDRLSLMRKVAEQNELLFSKINGRLAVVSAEISRIKAGMAAMSGYRSIRDNAGKIINNNH